jgi:excisionase family DNA binding protein
MFAEENNQDGEEERANKAVARESAKELSQVLRELPEAARASVRLDDQAIILPRRALVLLRDTLAEMAKGNAVTIVPTHAELTTQEAANLLNVSRPYLIKLLAAGEIPFTRTGTHRRIQLKAIMEYKEKRIGLSRQALDELARQAQEDDMGY